MIARQRLDRLLVARGLAPTRSRAAALIADGKVRLKGELARRPGQAVDETTDFSLDRPEVTYVSRAALKLAAALDHFAVSPAGRVALDVGASTGGFTQILLLHGAARAYAVDVGHGQMAASIEADPRVVLLEGTNARHLNDALIPERPGFITCDASFIGLEQVLPAALALAADGAILVALIKPQFEVGRAAVGKGGIVKDRDATDTAVERIRSWLGSRPGWTVQGVIDSPITGGDGNREYLICARHSG